MARWQISLLLTSTALAIGAFVGLSQHGSPDVRPLQKGDEYVAIGDSYTVAPALGPWTDANACMRTGKSYPHQIAATLQLRLKDVSCAGAATTNVTAPQTLRSTNIAPQADALSPDTDLVTISLGANDFDVFRSVALGCTALRSRDPAGAPCTSADATAGGRSLKNTMAAIERRLVKVIRYVGKRAPSARIIIVGYPEFFPEAGPCTQFPLALGDYRFAHDFNELIVRAQKRSAARAEVEYVDVFTASRGHDMCARDPWIAGMRSASRTAMPLHPYPQEQELVARLLLKRLT